MNSEDFPPTLFVRRKGIRHIRMSFDHHNRLVVGMPWQCPKRTAEKFVEKNREWVARESSRLAPVLDLEEYFATEPWVSLDGERVPVEVSKVSAGGNHWIFVEKQRRGLFQVLRTEDASIRLLKLVRKLASDSLARRVHHWAEIYGFSFGRVSVRDQNSRWGSCSQSRSISLNWRLLLVSPGTQDYVILHELAHLRHLNHSREFHRLLSELDPQRAEHEEELNLRGPSLMRVGRRLGGLSVEEVPDSSWKLA